MIITCEECSSSFSVNDSLIKETGSKVRCSKCDSVFVAYPQPAEDIAELETAEDDLTLDSDDQMWGEDEDLGLDDLDSDLGDFLGDEDEDEALAMSLDAEESELDLADFDDTLESKTGLASDDVIEETEGELELDLDFDQDDDSDLALEEESIDGDDLPDLDGFEDLADLDEDEPELEDLGLELESEADSDLELEGDDGHDLTDLEALLKQSEGKGIYVYTHGEMLPTHGYPELKKYPHFYGHFGTAWQNQIREFGKFPGPILMTTNCIQKPQGSYKENIFTTGLVGWPGVPHIVDKDFTPVIQKALEMQLFQVQSWIFF